jgi:hypothetical protein
MAWLKEYSLQKQSTIIWLNAVNSKHKETQCFLSDFLLKCGNPLAEILY